MQNEPGENRVNWRGGSNSSGVKKGLHIILAMFVRNDVKFNFRIR